MDSCRSKEERDLVDDFLKGKIEQAAISNNLWSKKWNEEELYTIKKQEKRRLPENFLEFVNKCEELCENDVWYAANDEDLNHHHQLCEVCKKAEEYTQERLTEAVEDGSMWTHDWDSEKAPQFLRDLGTQNEKTIKMPSYSQQDDQVDVKKLFSSQQSGFLNQKKLRDDEVEEERKFQEMTSFLEDENQEEFKQQDHTSLQRLQEQTPKRPKSGKRGIRSPESQAKRYQKWRSQQIQQENYGSGRKRCRIGLVNSRFKINTLLPKPKKLHFTPGIDPLPSPLDLEVLSEQDVLSPWSAVQVSEDEERKQREVHSSLRLEDLGGKERTQWEVSPSLRLWEQEELRLLEVRWKMREEIDHLLAGEIDERREEQLRKGENKLVESNHNSQNMLPNLPQPGMPTYSEVQCRPVAFRQGDAISYCSQCSTWGRLVAAGGPVLSAAWDWTGGEEGNDAAGGTFFPAAWNGGSGGGVEEAVGSGFPAGQQFKST